MFKGGLGGGPDPLDTRPPLCAPLILAEHKFSKLEKTEYLNISLYRYGISYWHTIHLQINEQESFMITTDYHEIVISVVRQTL